MDLEDSGGKPLPNDAYRWPQAQAASDFWKQLRPNVDQQLQAMHKERADAQAKVSAAV